MATVNATFRYNADFGKLSKDLARLQAQATALASNLTALKINPAEAAVDQKVLKDSVRNIEGLNTKMVTVTDSAQNFGKALEQNKLTTKQLFREVVGVGGQTEQLAKRQVSMLRSQVVGLGKDANGAMQAMVSRPVEASLTSAADKTAIAAQKTAIWNKAANQLSTNIVNVGKNVQWAGRQLMVGFTVPLGIATAGAIKNFNELDAEMTRFKKVYSDLGDSIAGSLENAEKATMSAAKEFSSAYGIASKETVALAADIAATGQSGEQLQKALQATTRLAVLGEVDRQEAMKTTLSLQSAFGYSLDEITNKINFMNAVENATSTSLQDMAEAIPRAGPVVQSLGGDIEDLTVMLVAMREGGISAAESANAIKSGLASMINPTQKARETAEGFGIALGDIVNNNKGDVMGMINELQKSLQGLTDFERAQVIEEIFGKYQFARMSALFENLGKQGSQTQRAMEAAASGTGELAATADKELNALSNSTSVRWKAAMENIKNAMMPLGQEMAETLIPIINKVSEILNWIQQLPEGFKTFGKWATIAIGAIIPVGTMFLGLIINLVGNIGKAAVKMKMFFGAMRGNKSFSLLDEQAMAASANVDKLTMSFQRQRSALQQLETAMKMYVRQTPKIVPHV